MFNIILNTCALLNPMIGISELSKCFC